ncbi:MAG: type IV pilus modification protein PilV [Steroidobacteraceae bacterium]
MRILHTQRAVEAGHCSRGFSLVEVMVALIVLSVGLLGIARMQVLALSSTSVAGKRALAAIEAASLAASMHENRGYWSNSGDAASATISLAGTTYSYTGASALSSAGAQNCTNSAAPCTPTAMAAYDLQLWATALQGLLPNDSAVIACGNITPITCTITINWFENAVGVNDQQAAREAVGTQAAMQNPTYVLYVQP